MKVHLRRRADYAVLAECSARDARHLFSSTVCREPRSWSYDRMLAVPGSASR